METYDKLLASLRERAKELECLYEVEKILSDLSKPLMAVFQSVVEAIPTGMQYPEITRARIVYEKASLTSPEFKSSDWCLQSEILDNGQAIGVLEVFYVEERPKEHIGPFLQEELRLLDMVTERLGHFTLFQRLELMRRAEESGVREKAEGGVHTWRRLIELLQASDMSLYMRISRKMLNHLYGLGVEEARFALHEADIWSDPQEIMGEVNVPGRHRRVDQALLMTEKPFELAVNHLSADTIMGLLQRWLLEDKAAFFINILANPRSSLNEIIDAVRRYRHVVADGVGLPKSVIVGMRVSLARRILTEQLDFLKVAKNYIHISNMRDILKRMILPADSHGKIGGKSAGILLAQRILEEEVDETCSVGTFKVAKTWYIASDEILHFITYNNLEDVVEQKFKDNDTIRQEYSNVIQLFKDSTFPPDFIKGLSAALDDFGETPLIVRSSSLLEDRLGTAFSGKYKSLFLANQGSKRERLSEMLNAIAEIYASVFGPDPIEYRREHGLLEFSEEMGILIQEVVGRKVGRFYLPAFGGVAFSNNEFRWSPRIKREDGIIRMVPGLGTRAVDRVSDDYPVLIVPGQPNLRANAALNEVVRYSPKKLDLINLETGSFETMDIAEVLDECGADYPNFTQVFSVLKNGMLQKPVRLLFNRDQDELVATFQGLLVDTSFAKNVRNMLNILAEVLDTPVDIEFAHDGSDFYLLQCRPQSYSSEDAPAPIPKDVDEDDILFSADRFVSNGWMPDITHIVYVDPRRYGALSEKKQMLEIGRAVGKLNKVLPKRKFILLGPGRWGSRGDIKLGVSVTYADISNTSMLIEIAIQKGDYVPDLSFGTHFFQDLVESRIRYLPLYPGNAGIHFNERFLLCSGNLLAEILPEHAEVSDVLRVIDVAAASGGRSLRVLMNADLDEAMGVLVTAKAQQEDHTPVSPVRGHQPAEDYWRWRLRMAESIANKLDGDRFGVAALYVLGSTKNASAGPGSDIDLLIHFRGTDSQRRDLDLWLEGWSLTLAEINYIRTGYRSKGLLDVHVVTDQDIADKTSFAIKIDAVTDAARLLPLGAQDPD